jgi:hypothetical protein
MICKVCNTYIGVGDYLKIKRGVYIHFKCYPKYREDSK